MEINNEELKIKLEELGIESDKIDEVVVFLESNKDIESDVKQRGTNVDKVIELKQQLIDETDWRKRASIAAALISLDLSP